MVRLATGLLVLIGVLSLARRVCVGVFHQQLGRRSRHLLSGLRARMETVRASRMLSVLLQLQVRGQVNAP
jgi:hypothetical protein